MGHRVVSGLPAEWIGKFFQAASTAQEAGTLARRHAITNQPLELCSNEYAKIQIKIQIYSNKIFKYKYQFRLFEYKYVTKRI